MKEIHGKTSFSGGAGLADYAELNVHDSLGFLALAIFGAASEIRTLVLPQLSLRDGIQCREALRIAESIVQQRVLYLLTDDAAPAPMRLPLPGLAGLVTREERFFRDEVAYFLHELREAICAHVLPSMGSENRAVVLAEALAMAEEIIDAGSGNTEIGQIREAHPRLQYHRHETPTRLFRRALAIKAAALGSPLAA